MSTPTTARIPAEGAAPASLALSRRGFIAGSAATTVSLAAPAGGLMLGFFAPLGTVNAQNSAQTPANIPPEINCWVVVQPDDQVVIRIARSEMGQGTLTGLAQLVAEELGCDWSKVTTEYPTPGQNLARNRVWGNFSTGGSRGIRESHDHVRKGGAAARLMLVQAAATSWGVPAADCRTAASVISHPASGRSTPYGQVASAAAKLTPPTDVVLKDPKDWTIAGKPLPRLDTAPKTTGAQVYGMDLTLPGMLNAAIADCPVVGGKVRSFDAAAVMKMPGVKAVLPVGDSAVAVVADTWWRAKTALAALKIDWDEGPNTGLNSAGIAAMLKAGLDAPEAVIGVQAGQAKDALAGAARTLEAVYAYPYQNHATMEVMNATAKFTPAAGGQAARCEVWTPTQNGEAGLDASGKLTALHMRISGQSILAGLFPQNIQNGRDPVVFQGLSLGGTEGALGYAIPHLLIDHAMRNPPVRPGFWRGVNLNQNAIYLECFIDEIAHATQQDPLALRRQLLAASPKHLAVLNAVAQRAGWGTTAAPINGQPVHRGLAQIMGFGSYVAACAEVSVSADGVLTVHRIVAATDCGHAVNPQQIEAQVEGSFAYGLSAALFGEITVEGGRIQQSNFHDYPALLMAQMPKVETIVMPSGGFWGGVGEPTIAVAAPAVLNAIFAATGQRIRTLPIKNQRLKRA